jgi:hypothetical protein
MPAEQEKIIPAYLTRKVYHKLGVIEHRREARLLYSFQH